MNKNNIKQFIGWGLFLIIFISYLYYDSNKSINKIMKHPKYAVAKITSDFHYKTTWKTAGTDFEYVVNNKTFNGVISMKGFSLGEKYLVIYDSIDIKGCIFFPFYPLPDSIQAPVNGWRYDEVPIPIDSIRIRKYVLGEE